MCDFGHESIVVLCGRCACTRGCARDSCVMLSLWATCCHGGEHFVAKLIILRFEPLRTDTAGVSSTFCGRVSLGRISPSGALSPRVTVPIEAAVLIEATWRRTCFSNWPRNGR